MQNEIKALLEITQNLRDKYHLGFPLDGRLVGDMGEALVKKYFNVELHPPNMNCYDAFEIGTERQIQIKSSMKYNFYYSFKYNPDYFMAVHINEDATLEVVYNGPGQLIKDYINERGLKDYNKTWYSLSVGVLKRLNEKVIEEHKIKERKS
jgi:hypothetical protein